MQTQEEKEREQKAKSKRDRKIFYLGMTAGAVLLLTMILINRFLQ